MVKFFDDNFEVGFVFDGRVEVNYGVEVGIWFFFWIVRFKLVEEFFYDIDYFVYVCGSLDGLVVVVMVEYVVLGDFLDVFDVVVDKVESYKFGIGVLKFDICD